MSLGLAHRKELQKRRNQRFWLIIKIIFFLTIFIGSSYLAFDTGQKIALRNVEYSQEQFNQQATELDNMRIQLGNTEAALNKMQKILPTSEIQDLLNVINQKAANGIGFERMSALIAGMTKDGKCDDQIQSKRFIVSTPISQHQESAASFYRGLVTVIGKGSPTLNEQGNPESWFDPEKPVTVSFTLPGGEKQETDGILPLYHSVIVKDKEYRFTIINGQRSFAEITVISCDL
ncbi:MAG: type 4a pilus biogenesis protein PilO [Emcibacter sp.]|nr:type 4a pilus biogenesis protein PilO [Emcibacter sp.]